MKAKNYICLKISILPNTLCLMEEINKGRKEEILEAEL